MKNNENVDIFIYSHKPFTPIVDNKVYKVLTNCHEKDYKFHTKLKILRDYDGEDNLSDKNLMYNEYSGFYWLWKNYPLKDYIGMNHYSRMYAWLNNVPDIDEIFKTKKMILNQPVDFNIPYWQQFLKPEDRASNEAWYRYWHNINDFNLLRDVIKDLFPDYMDGFEKMAKVPYCYNSSMFIMKKDDFTTYCDFIFPVLEEICKRRGYKTSDDCRQWVHDHKEEYIKAKNGYYDVEMQSRIVGYLAERAMNAYIMHGGENSLEKNSLIVPWFNVPKIQ